MAHKHLLAIIDGEEGVELGLPFLHLLRAAVANCVRDMLAISLGGKKTEVREYIAEVFAGGICLGENYTGVIALFCFHDVCLNPFPQITIVVSEIIIFNGTYIIQCSIPKRQPCNTVQLRSVLYKRPCCRDIPTPTTIMPSRMFMYAIYCCATALDRSRYRPPPRFCSRKRTFFRTVRRKISMVQ